MSDYNPNPFALHIINDNVKEVKKMLQNGANPDENLNGIGWSALTYAVSNGRKEIVELLLKYKANVNHKRNGYSFNDLLSTVIIQIFPAGFSNTSYMINKYKSIAIKLIYAGADVHQSLRVFNEFKDRSISEGFYYTYYDFACKAIDFLSNLPKVRSLYVLCLAKVHYGHDRPNVPEWFPRLLLEWPDCEIKF